MQQKILILIGGHLCTAPRAQKEAVALSELGHAVTVAGKWDDDTMAEWDKKLQSQAPYSFHPVLDMRPGKLLSRLLARLEFKALPFLNTLSASDIPALPAYGLRQLKNYAVNFDADLTIAHSEGSLWVVHLIHKRGKKVGVDFEDWFSKDLPAGARDKNTISILEKLEHYLLEHASYLACPTEAMAEAMVAAYRQRKPAVLLNCFPPESETSGDCNSKEIRLIWFSQTIGKGRGLNTLFAALGNLETPIRLTLLGRCSDSIRRWIESSFPSKKHSLEIKAALPPWELPLELAAHDIGFAIETAEVPSTDLTASNKYFQYLTAGLAIIATNTRGQQEVWPVENPPGLLVSTSDSDALAQALEKLVSDRELLSKSKKAALSLAKQFDPTRKVTPVISKLLKAD